MESKERSDWRDQKALEHYELISPLLATDLDRDAKVALRKKIAAEHDISVRTLRRYEAGYAENGFSGLRPVATHRNSASLPANFNDLVAEAIQLKREVPTRSIHQIIFILEGEGKAAPGELKRSTLQRHLYNEGFGRRQLHKYIEGSKSSSKRFCKPHRMMLLQADIKYGPDLPIGKKHSMAPTYLSSIIDDYSRYILYSRFYDNQTADIVEDSFRRAILLYGKFDAGYCDNGKQYISTQLQKSTGKLGIYILHAPPRSGKSKGKVEKFHQVVDAFIAEAKAHKIKTLEALNEYWECYLDEYYLKQPHEGISEYYKSFDREVSDEGISPEMEWNRDSRQLVFIDAGTVGKAFLHHEDRIVDKGGCIDFKGTKYEVSAALIGAKVEIAYDSMNTEVITVNYKDMEPIHAKKVVIGEFCDKTPEIPASLLPLEPDKSRMLEVLKKRHDENKQIKANAISYGAFRKDGD